VYEWHFSFPMNISKLYMYKKKNLKKKKKLRKT
jgi:hypothetical protein